MRDGELSILTEDISRCRQSYFHITSFSTVEILEMRGFFCWKREIIQRVIIDAKHDLYSLDKPFARGLKYLSDEARLDLT